MLTRRLHNALMVCSALLSALAILRIDSPESTKNSFRHKLFAQAKELFHFEEDFIQIGNIAHFKFDNAIKLMISVVLKRVVLAVVAGLVVGVRAWKTQQKKDPYQNLGSGMRQAAGAPAVRSNPPPVQPGVQAPANPAVRTPVRTTLPLPTNAPAPRR